MMYTKEAYKTWPTPTESESSLTERSLGLDWLGQHIPAQKETRPGSLVSHTLATALVALPVYR
ncbi:Uncharacterized protein APZ42_018646 [Daphnia magna]|uniref:Uncharacterized protein n=1 Tax=Daphnia magna TaxID=35525 RepID=A0A164YPF9_9CRUS|nr:Uncharacterized protein APZ42_018646 [Daphnia magna]